MAKYPESVFWSQVFEFLATLESRPDGIIERIVLLAGVDSRVSRAEVRHLEDACREGGISLQTFAYHSIYPFLFERTVRGVRTTLSRLDVDWKNTVLHIRDEMNALFLWRAGHRDVRQTLVDVRAANVEEVSIYGRAPTALKALKLRYKRAALQMLARYPHVSVVSERLRDYVYERASLEGETVQCGVVPSLAGRGFHFDPGARVSTRRELGLAEGDIAVVFSSGGTSAWQQNERIVAHFELLGVKIINLSKIEIDAPHVSNLFVDYSDVPRYLMAADIAVLWREDNIVNHVASPVKFAEYVCCGLPVVVSRSVCGAAAFIQNGHPGVVLDEFSSVSTVSLRRLAGERGRDALGKSARSHYGVENGVETYLGRYQSMIDGPTH